MGAKKSLQFSFSAVMLVCWGSVIWYVAISTGLQEQVLIGIITSIWSVMMGVWGSLLRKAVHPQSLCDCRDELTHTIHNTTHPQTHDFNNYKFR